MSLNPNEILISFPKSSSYDEKYILEYYDRDGEHSISCVDDVEIYVYATTLKFRDSSGLLIPNGKIRFGGDSNNRVAVIT